MGIKAIITGATGMVGEGVLLECLENPAVERVLSVSRRSCGHTHPKLTECLVPDFMQLDAVEPRLTGYDACFFCAGVSSAGMSEADYTRITYDTTLSFAGRLARLNPQLVFCYVSGRSTDSTEKGRSMWARVKGRTENALLKLPFKRAHNFRPALMTPAPGQKNLKTLYRVLLALTPLFRLLFGKEMMSLRDVGVSMIHAVEREGTKPVLEVADMKALVP